MYLGLETDYDGKALVISNVLQYIKGNRFLVTYDQYDLKSSRAIINLLKINKLKSLEVLFVNTINHNYFSQFIDEISKEYEKWAIT